MLKGDMLECIVKLILYSGWLKFAFCFNNMKLIFLTFLFEKNKNTPLHSLS